MLQTRAMVEEMFQHTAARRRLDALRVNCVRNGRFQHTAARRRLGFVRKSSQPSLDCFNTQPPEGGWVPYDPPKFVKAEFQHTAARRRLDNANTADVVVRHVSTHSRPKAAGADVAIPRVHETVSTHSRPKAAGAFQVSQHGRPFSFNTQPPEGGWLITTMYCVW